MKKLGLLLIPMSFLSLCFASVGNAVEVHSVIYGWQCTDLAHEGLSADIFYNGRSLYAIHIHATLGEGRPPEEIANVTDAQGTEENGWMVYSGQDDGNRVELRVGSSEDPVQGNPGVLKVDRMGSFEVMPYPVNHQFNLICMESRSRF